MGKKKVVILGGTGAVGHYFALLLGDSKLSSGVHPDFEIVAITGSPSSAGKKFSHKWQYEKVGDFPEGIEDLIITGLDTSYATELNKQLDGLSDKVDIAFSALPNKGPDGKEMAKPVEIGLAKRGVHVFSNASFGRMDNNIPLIVPEINGIYKKGKKEWASDYDVIALQPWYQESGGLIVKNPNCSVIGLALALAPFREPEFRVVDVVTNQALSGAGFSAYPDGEMEENIIPYIRDEELKIEREIHKIMHLKRSSRVTAHANRVPVPDGHMEYVFISSRSNSILRKIIKYLGHTLGYEDKESKESREDQILRLIREYNPLAEYNLPTSPPRPLLYVGDLLNGSEAMELGFEVPYQKNMWYTHPDARPQPKLDVNNGRGMAVTLGQFKWVEGKEHHVYFTVLSHNVIRGAAGASILNAELFYALLEKGEILGQNK